MISQKSQLDAPINGKNHIYQCDASSTLAECFEAINIFRSYIFGRIKEAEEQAKSEEKKDEPQPE